MIGIDIATGAEVTTQDVVYGYDCWQAYVAAFAFAFGYGDGLRSCWGICYPLCGRRVCPVPNKLECGLQLMEG